MTKLQSYTEAVAASIPSDVFSSWNTVDPFIFSISPLFNSTIKSEILIYCDAEGDIVFSDGKIISDSFPYKSLKRILNELRVPLEE